MSEIELELPRERRRWARFFYDNFNRLKILLSAGEGVTDTFTTADAKTVTVTNGIITDIT